MSPIIAYLIDLLIIPLVIVSYDQSSTVIKKLNLAPIYFYFILFIFIHFSSSLVIILSNLVVYRKMKASLFVVGIGPTIAAFLTLLAITILPFLKWPFYILKWIPNFDQWIVPFIMGFSAFIVQIFLRKTINDSIWGVTITSQVTPPVIS